MTTKLVDVEMDHCECLFFTVVSFVVLFLTSAIGISLLLDAVPRGETDCEGNTPDSEFERVFFPYFSSTLLDKKPSPPSSADGAREVKIAGMPPDSASPV